MAERVEFSEFVAGFIAEAEEHLAAANRNLLLVDEALGMGQTPARLVRELFRALHTIKGLAAMVGVEPIVEVAHELESVLRDADRSGGRLTRSSVDLLLRGVRAIEARVSALGRGQEVPAAEPKLLRELQALRGAGPVAGPVVPSGTALPPDFEQKLDAAERTQLAQALRAGKRGFVIDFAPSAERMQAGVTITSVREALSALGELIRVLPRSAPPESPRRGISFGLLLVTASTTEGICAAARLLPGEVMALAPPSADAETVVAAEEFLGEAEEVLPASGRRALVRVDVSRLDEALEDLSSLLITRHRLKLASQRLAEKGVDVRELDGVLAENSRQLRNLRTSIMSARMVPLSEVLARVPLLVRGLTRTLGKAAHLELDLQNVAVDKAVGDRVFPAIVHLLRNALDHGLESAEQRRAAGKPDEGQLRVSAREEGGGYLRIAVSDDGRGIDAEAVAARARAPVPKDTAGLMALIARPGLSTRTEADRTSGRGMGVDIVQRIAQDLGGAVLLDTEAGRGTTFTVRVPLSITIVDAFTFQSGPQAYAVPVSMVEEIIEVDPASVVHAPSPKGPERGQLLHRRGEPMVLFNLGELFGIADANEARKALIVRRGDVAFAFGVTRMMGQQEIVVRPLEDPLVRVTGVAGATDLGDGRATLVLDLLAVAFAQGEVRTGASA